LRFNLKLESPQLIFEVPESVVGSEAEGGAPEEAAT